MHSGTVIPDMAPKLGYDFESSSSSDSAEGPEMEKAQLLAKIEDLQQKVDGTKAGARDRQRKCRAKKKAKELEEKQSVAGVILRAREAAAQEKLWAEEAKAAAKAESKREAALAAEVFAKVKKARKT